MGFKQNGYRHGELVYFAVPGLPGHCKGTVTALLLTGEPVVLLTHGRPADDSRGWAAPPSWRRKTYRPGEYVIERPWEGR